MCVSENISVSKKWNDEDCCRGKAMSDVVDDGHIPGDGLGFCGFDASFYL